MSIKWSNSRQKSDNLCCKIFNVCLTILWTLDIIELKCETAWINTLFKHPSQHLPAQS